MPSPLAHGSLVLFVRAFAARGCPLGGDIRRRPAFLTAAGLVALWAPDVDFLLRLGVDRPEWAHGGATHSLAAGLVIGLLFACTCRLYYGVGAPVGRLWVIGVACGWSHALMDLATWGGKGIMILWPFSAERFSTIPLFFGAHRSQPWAWELHLTTLVTELAFAGVVWWFARWLRSSAKADAHLTSTHRP